MAFSFQIFIAMGPLQHLPSYLAHWETLTKEYLLFYSLPEFTDGVGEALKTENPQTMY